MAQQTLKRHGSHGSEVDNGGDDGQNGPLPKFDVTWGGEIMPKKPRYVYNFSLDSNSDSSAAQDSDDSETVLSIQSKSTMGLVSDTDSCSCNSECLSQNSCDSSLTEYEARISSSSNIMNSNSSDSSTSLEYKTEKINALCDKTVPSSDNEYDDSDVQATPKKNVSTTARYINCIWCRKKNNNPCYQYCTSCYQFRKDYFVPHRKKKQIRIRSEKLKDSQEFDLFGPILSQEKVNSKNIDTSMAKAVDENSNNLCNICLILPKNGIFNHGKIGHVYCCYTCAKKLWKKCNRCPLCNAKIKFVTKMITS